MFRLLTLRTPPAASSAASASACGWRRVMPSIATAATAASIHPATSPFTSLYSSSPCTCAYTRTFATSSSRAGGSTSTSARSSAAQQLCALIDEEVSDVSSHEDETVNEYIKAFKFNVEVSSDGNNITAQRRTDSGAEITVEFPTQAEEEDSDSSEDGVSDELGEDGEGRANDGDQDQENENDNDNGEEEEQDIEPQKPHYFHVDITNRGGSYLRLFCLATPDQHIDIYQLAFDRDSAARAVSPDADSAVSERELLNWNDLPDELASKLADYLHDTMKIDDDLASFVQAYSQQVRAQQYVEKMSKLKKFLQ